MLGVIVAIILSYAALWLTSREHITVLGILPTSQRAKEFILGFLIMATFCTINFFGQAYVKGTTYTLNVNYTFTDTIDGVWWAAKAALFEELIFRGALLYILIKYIDIVRACLISSVAFGIYHWFSYGLIGGSIIPIIYVFLLTGAGGWMFAFAFAKTKSISAPLGLHLGWILMSIVVFSDGPIGDQLLIAKGGDLELGGWANLAFFLWQAVVVPAIVTWYLLKKYPLDHPDLKALT